MIEHTKLKAGKYRVPATLEYKDGRIFIKFKFNRKMIEEVKSMEGHRWHGFEDPPRKIWSIKDSQRNRFQLSYLKGENPYEPFDKPLKKINTSRPIYQHQKIMVAHALTRHYCIFACEMGTGKSLAAIEAMEQSGLSNKDVWYVGPKSGVKAVSRELIKWDSKVHPKMMTYEKLVKTMRDWDGSNAPKMVVFDECSKIKNPTSQRSQAAMHLADAVRDEHGWDGYVIEMSGTPAPKAPIDWWHQCLTLDTWILTSNGPKQVKDLLDKPFKAHVSQGDWNSTGFKYIGEKPVYRVETFEGYSLKATPDHRVLTLNGFKEVQYLTNEDKIIFSSPLDIEWGGEGAYKDGYLIGLLIGNGNIYREKYGRLQFFDDDYEILGFAKKCLPNEPNVVKSGEAYQIFDNYITTLIENFGLSNQKEITEHIESASKEFLRGFITGFFDANGHVAKDRLRIGFGQTDRARIEVVQRILGYFGVFCNIREKAPNTSKIDGREINSKKSNELLITGEDAIKYNKEFGFVHPKKSSRLEKAIKNSHEFLTTRAAQVKSVTYIGFKSVFDAEVEKVHRFAANNLVVHNCEVAQPGFLKEGSQGKLKMRLCIVEQRQSIAGGVYPHIVTWLDDENKCAVCGKYRDDDIHSQMYLTTGEGHQFEKSKNEVNYLYKRMRGLTLVQFKRDCLDIPEKQYEVINVKPTPQTMRAAKLIKSKSTRAIQALTLLRELSDGFQYQEEETGHKKCVECDGTGGTEGPRIKEGVDVTSPDYQFSEEDVEYGEKVCDNCGGEGIIRTYSRTTDTVESPKDEAFIEELDSHEDIGRYIVWGGFTGTIDRLVQICHKYGWATLRVDGRGYLGESATGEHIDSNELLDALDGSNPRKQELLDKHPKVCFVGHPKAGGMALTLTASPTELFYSNTFDGEARMQAEDRFHRPGMDVNRGATVKDLIHLPTDKLVLENLYKKKKLQNMTMGQLEEVFSE